MIQKVIDKNLEEILLCYTSNKNNSLFDSLE
jgi:hypothetical protein